MWFNIFCGRGDDWTGKRGSTPKSWAEKLTIILTEGPYRSQYADLAFNIANAALDMEYNVNLFLYMDATHIPKRGQNPHSFPNAGEKFKILLRKGADIRACIRCATARDGSLMALEILDILKEVRVYASHDDLKARGIKKEQLIEGMEVFESYEVLVLDMMEKMDQIISL